MKQLIYIYNIVGDSFCIEAKDGQKVFTLIQKSFSQNQQVTLSFKNVEMLTTAFLNTAIGQLYRDFTEQQIRENLDVIDLSQSGLISLKRVVDTAKLYYKNPDAMKQSMNDILGEDDD